MTVLAVVKEFGESTAKTTDLMSTAQGTLALLAGGWMA